MLNWPLAQRWSHGYVTSFRSGFTAGNPFFYSHLVSKSVHLSSRSLLSGVLLAVLASASPVAGQAANRETPVGTGGGSKASVPAPQSTAPKQTFEVRKPFAEFSASAERLREGVVSKAREAVGTKYKLGGTKLGVGFDCSGLVQFAMSALEIVLPRTAQSQSQVGVEVPKDVAALQPGDVLTFGTGKRISHVGIYVGDGKMIHASTSKRRVIETSITQRSPLIRQWKGVRRYVEGVTSDTLGSILAIADSLR